MARTSSINPGLLRRQTESTPNTNTEAEAEKKEETQSEPKATEKENSASGSSDVSVEEETTQRKNQAIAEGKKSKDAKEGKQKRDFNEVTRGRENTKGVVIGEAKKSERVSTPVRSGKRKVRYAVRSPCTLKSPLKKFYVDVDSDDEEPKGKGREKEADDFEDPGAHSEETCKKVKKDRNGDDDSDDNNGGGDGAGAHTNLSNLSLGEGLISGN